MPQELHVVRCFSCETFQVDIIKKISKWTCKMCGEKQSLKKVYGQGTGKDCRLLVQELNQQRITLQHELLENIKPIKVVPDDNKDVSIRKAGEPTPSKWLEYVHNHVDNKESEVENGEYLNFTFESPATYRSVRSKQYKKFKANVKNPCTLPAHFGECDSKGPLKNDCHNGESVTYTSLDMKNSRDWFCDQKEHTYNESAINNSKSKISPEFCNRNRDCCDGSSSELTGNRSAVYASKWMKFTSYESIINDVSNILDDNETNMQTDKTKIKLNNPVVTLDSISKVQVPSHSSGNNINTVGVNCTLETKVHIPFIKYGKRSRFMDDKCDLDSVLQF